MSQTETPANVIEALAAVERDLPGIAKSQDPNAGIKYAYRGIEAITREVQELLGKYGLVIVPRETSMHSEDITVNGNPWTDTIVAIEYDIYGPGGVTDKITVGPIHAIGRDNSDKGANKARTQAYKYALLHTFCIGDGKDDPDAQHHATDERAARVDPAKVARDELSARIKALPEAQREQIKQLCEANGWPKIPYEWDDDQFTVITNKVDALAKSSPAPEASPPSTTDAEAGGNPAGTDAPPASPSSIDRDSYLAGIKGYEDQLDEAAFAIYTAWLADLFGDASADPRSLPDADLEQVWSKLGELVSEGALA